VLVLLLACDPAPAARCPEDMALVVGGLTTIGVSPRQAAWHQEAHVVDLPAFCMDRYEFPNQAGALPLNRVTWDEASAHCAAAGKRLCGSDEWERACRGLAGSRYVYGDSYDRTRCNTPLEAAGRINNQLPLAPSGSHPGCVSAEGIHDLNGNLSEWVLDAWTEPGPPGVTVDAETWRVLRGGTMWAKTAYGQDCLSRHGHHRSTYRNDDDGLRCCRDAGP
jgi:sulfatase modifying factor 1